MSDPHDPTPSQKAVRDLYANGTDTMALIARYRDQIADLSEHFKSYRSLERLVSPEYKDETETGAPNARADLGALLRILNGQMQRQLDKMAKTALALQLEVEALKPRPGDRS